MSSGPMSFASFGLNVFEAYQIWEAGEEQEDIFKYSASILRREGERAREQAMWLATERRRTGEELAGTIRSQYAKAGVTLEGTPLLLLEREAMAAEEDALMLRYTGELERQRLFEQAAIQEQEGEALREKAEYEGLGEIFEGFGGFFNVFG